MPNRRRKSSGFIVTIWVILFVTGLLSVLLFFDGRWAIQDGRFVVEESGYVDFSSDGAVLYADEKFLAKDGKNIILPLQRYDFCIQRFFYKGRCFNATAVQKNSSARTNLEGIFLQKSHQSAQKITPNMVFWHPEGKGLFWYDDIRKMIFFLDKKSEEIEGYYAGLPVDTVLWNDIKSTFELLATTGEKEVFDPFSSSFFDDLEFLTKSKNITYGVQNIFLQLQEGDKQLMSSFSEPFDRVIDIKNTDAKLLVFPSSVYLLYENGMGIQKITKKDEESEVLFLPQKKEIFWQQGGILWKQEI